jgi:hypothetical protein
MKLSIIIGLTSFGHRLTIGKADSKIRNNKARPLAGIMAYGSLIKALYI